MHWFCLKSNYAVMLPLSSVIYSIQHNAVHLQRLAAKSAASCQGIPKHIQRPAICGHCIPPEVHSISHFSEFSLYTNRIQRDNTQRSLSFCIHMWHTYGEISEMCTLLYTILQYFKYALTTKSLYIFSKI